MRNIARHALLTALLLMVTPRAHAAARPTLPMRVASPTAGTVMTPAESLWFNRLIAGMNASNLLADNLMLSGDSYTIGRDGGNYTEALLLAFRATGDRRFLDRVYELSERARGTLRDAWLDGTTDGYTDWLWLIDPANATYYGKDTNWLDESIASGNAALWMWAFHVNRTLDPRYAAAADFWRGWLENHFLAKWYARAGGNPLNAWNTPYAAFYKPDTEPRSANWRLAYYLWKVTGNTFYRDRADQIAAQLAAANVINPNKPLAYRWAKELDPSTQTWQSVNYANYYMRVVIEMNLEGISPFSSPVQMKRFAATFRDVVYATSLPGLTSMKNDVNGGGSTAYALYAFNGFSAWDSTGFLMDLATRSLTGAGNYASGGLSKAARNDVYLSAYALMALSPVGPTATVLSLFDAVPQEDRSVRIEFRLGAGSTQLQANLFRLSPNGIEATRINEVPFAGELSHVLYDTPPDDVDELDYELREAGPEERVIGRLHIQLQPSAATGLRLSQNEPNPFTSSTRIRFELARTARVRLAIRDAAGRTVRVLREGELAPGSYSAAWDGRDASGRAVFAGVYFYALENDGAVVVRRAVRLN